MSKSVFIVTFYGYGMQPQRKFYLTESEAVAEYKRMRADPHSGVSSVKEERIIMEVGYDD